MCFDANRYTHGTSSIFFFFLFFEHGFHDLIFNTVPRFYDDNHSRVESFRVSNHLDSTLFHARISTLSSFGSLQVIICVTSRIGSKPDSSFFSFENLSPRPSSTFRSLGELYVFCFLTVRHGRPLLASLPGHYRHALLRRFKVHFQVKDDERIGRHDRFPSACRRLADASGPSSSSSYSHASSTHSRAASSLSSGLPLFDHWFVHAWIRFSMDFSFCYVSIERTNNVETRL